MYQPSPSQHLRGMSALSRKAAVAMSRHSCSPACTASVGTFGSQTWYISTCLLIVIIITKMTMMIIMDIRIITMVSYCLFCCCCCCCYYYYLSSSSFIIIIMLEPLGPRPGLHDIATHLLHALCSKRSDPSPKSTRRTRRG